MDIDLDQIQSKTEVFEREGHPMVPMRTSEMYQLIDLCRDLRDRHRKARTAVESIKEWADDLRPSDGIEYGKYYPSFAVNTILDDLLTEGK